MSEIVIVVLRHPAFFIISIVYLALQYIGVFPVFYILDALLIGNFVWFFVENWRNPVFQRTLKHGISALSFIIIILNFHFAEHFSTMTVIIAFIAFSVNLTFMVYSSKSNTDNFIQASRIVLFLNRFKRIF